MPIWSGFRPLLLILLVSGCQTPPPAPVQDLRPPPSQRIMYHLVSRGDTLYSIAWRYQLDVVKLASANGISAPYTIRPGQRLSLDTSRVVAPATRAAPVVKATPSVKPGSRSTPAPASVVPVPRTMPPSPASPAVSLPAGPLSWQWPAQGRVTREYDSSRVFKGLNIHATPGGSVLAAAPGVVVYAGDGLRGYGLLIIIKHSETLLSAYAHNRKIFIREGMVVGRGQKIAEIGSEPPNRGRLYFEIRQNGRPIDPTRLLPRQ